MNSNLGSLAELLRRQYDAAPENRKVASIHLFGIEHRQALIGINKQELAERAGLSRSYGTELAKAAVLGEYVEIVRPLL